MPDVVDAATRSRMMAGIRSANTQPETRLRTALHRQGFRYRLHAKLPGRPDFVLPKHRAAVFVHGCYWHGHDCSLFRLPGTRREFWQKKIEGNRARDIRSCAALAAAGWRSLTVWECAFRGRHQLGFDETVRKVSRWIVTGGQGTEIRGTA